MDALELQLERLVDSLRKKMELRLEIAEFGVKRWKLPKPRVCVMEAKRSKSIRGWHSYRRWEQGAVKVNEIVLTPASVSKGVFNAAEVVAHELVHLANAVAGCEDTSRQGRYHNTHFKMTAEVLGLVVSKHETNGWCVTRLGDVLAEQIRDLIRDGTLKAHVFKYQWNAGRAAEASLARVSCSCGVFAYVTRNHAKSPNLRCVALR